MLPQYSHRQSEWGAAARLVPSIILIGLGALFLLDNLHIVYFQDWVRYWPAILIAAGLVKLVDSHDQRGRVAGGILFGVGAVLLAQSLRILDVSIGDLWPLFLIAMGLWLLFQRVVPHGSRHMDFGETVSSSANLDETVIFSGYKRVVNSQDFKGATITAIFGGIELDLRKAGMVADSAVLEINAIFGGAEVTVPEHWSVSMEGAAIFGGFGDHSVQPDMRMPGTKRLIVKGTTIFGGANVKN